MKQELHAIKKKDRMIGFDKLKPNILYHPVNDCGIVKQVVVILPAYEKQLIHFNGEEVQLVTEESWMAQHSYVVCDKSLELYN